MEPLIDDTVPVAIEDLLVIRAALNSGYHHATVLDLADQYRKLHQRPQQSKLTMALANALTLVTAHIELSQPDNQPEASDD